jgi:hypothetical protein
MAEENDLTPEPGAVPEVKNDGTPSPAPAHEYSDVEKQAMAQGWVPEDQYAGHGKWRSAEDFLDRGELFAKIDENKRRYQALEQTTTDLKRHLERVRKTEYNRALETLRAERKAALAEGDAEAVVQAEDKIDNLKSEFVQEQQQAAQQAQQALPNPVFVAWAQRNTWYETDKAMKVYADQIGHELALQGYPPKAILDEVEKRTKKEFQHKFVNPNRAKATEVEGGGSRGSQPKETFKLTEEETRVMNRFVKAGVLTKEEYIADLKAERGV